MATYSGTMTFTAYTKTTRNSTGNTAYDTKRSTLVGRNDETYTYSIYRGVRTISPPETANIPSDITQISKITLEIETYAYNNNITVIYGGLGSSSNTASAMYTIIGQMEKIGSVTVSDRETKTVTSVITDQTTISKMMTNGIGLRLSDETLSDAQALVTIGYTLEYTNTTIPPVTTFKNTTGSVMCSALHSIGWTYSQFSDSAQNGVECDVDNHGTWANNFTYDSTFTAISGLRAATMNKAKYPAITAASEDVNVRLRAVSAAGVWSEYSTMVLTLKFPVCTAVSPSGGETKLASDSITLTWQVSAVDSLDIGTYPSKFDIQYSQNGGELWIDIAKKVAASGSAGTYTYTIAANTLPAGIIKWRVRAYVASSLSGEYTVDEWGSETFACRVQAGTSSVTCDGKPQPTLSWTSSSQVAFQVRFDTYDSGAVYSTVTSYTIPKLYTDGTYAVQVRTQASDGQWSEWTDTEYVTIKNVSTAATLSISAQTTRHAAVVTWTGTADKFILYRNGTPIYAGTAKTYTDVLVNGEATYFVRALASSGYYTQGASVTVNAVPQNDCMYSIDNAEWIPLMYSLSSRTRSYSKSAEVTYKHYAGREKPIAYYTGATTRQVSVAYAFKTCTEVEKLNGLIGKTVIYKDTRGGLLTGVLGSVSLTAGTRLYSASFSITEVDVEDEVIL
jgi:hypothetical protein